MDYDAQWKTILTGGSFSGEASLVLSDGTAVSLRGMESAGDNGQRDSVTGRWSHESTDSYHSFTVPSADYYEALGDDSVLDCRLVVGGKRYGIAGVTGTEMHGGAIRLWLHALAEDEDDDTAEEGEA